MLASTSGVFEPRPRKADDVCGRSNDSVGEKTGCGESARLWAGSPLVEAAAVLFLDEELATRRGRPLLRMLLGWDAAVATLRPRS